MVFYADTQSQTHIIAKALGENIVKGCFIALQGDLGAGKTAFVKGLAEGIGSKDTVTSPTFALMHIYEGGRLPLYHFDLYRIDEEECYTLGFDEYFFNAECICAVEWSERLSLLPENTVTVKINILQDNIRAISIEAKDENLLVKGWEKFEYTCS